MHGAAGGGGFMLVGQANGTARGAAAAQAVEGDRATGLRSLPVTLGVERAAKLACVVMALPQIEVIVLLWRWDLAISALTVSLLLAAQLACMPKMLRDPAKYAPWYNATGVTLYVLGMLAAALGLGGYI